MKTMDIPAGPEQVTAEWLTDALRQNGVIRGSAVAGFDTKIVGEGSGFIGQLARLGLRYDRAEPGAPGALIAKFPGASEAGREIGNLFRFYEREIRFYEEIADRVDLRTPKRYHSAMDVGRGEYVLLLEDLAPAVVGDQVTGCSLAEARLAVEELARFHAAWWASPELKTMDWMLVVDDPVHQSAQQSYADAWQPFVENFAGGLSKEMLGIAERIGTKVIDLLHRFADEPWTIMHGDYRLDNMFFAPPGAPPSLAVVDWQITSRGRGIFDLAYFICGALAPEMRKSHEMELVRMYYDILQQRGVRGYTWERCLREYRTGALYLLVYVVISLGTLDSANERGVALFNAWLERATAAILDLNAAELL
jgi:hypothetical protein